MRLNLSEREFTRITAGYFALGALFGVALALFVGMLVTFLGGFA